MTGCPRLAGLATVLVLVGCGTGTGADDDGRPRIDAAEIDALSRACTEVIGDLARPVEVRPVYVDDRGEAVPLAADGAVDLVRPLQGGHVLMVGFEAKNLRGCTPTILGTLRDPATGAVIAEESRPSQLLLGADGWGHLAYPPSVTSANLSTCPQNGLPRDIDGNTWRLELTLLDGAEVLGRWSGDVIPFCRVGGPDPFSCACECDADFMFGQACPVDVDAGVAGP